jgi:hypothetical protein
MRGALDERWSGDEAKDHLNEVKARGTCETAEKAARAPA